MTVHVANQIIKKEWTDYNQHLNMAYYVLIFDKAWEVILEKFNTKYNNLGENQKILLKEYVNSVSNSPSLKSYINEEIKKVKRDLTKYSKKVTDKAVAIKLNETKDLIKPLCKKSSVHDDNVSNLLNYYELINELKTIHG